MLHNVQLLSFDYFDVLYPALGAGYLCALGVVLYFCKGV